MRGMALVLATTLALRRRLTQFLTAEGFTVASTVLEDLVLERALARTPDVRLVALEAADERRAAELLTELRRSEPLLPVLMITSQTLPEEEVSLLLSGPGAVLPPGFSMPDLEQALERMMP
jgi:DNA-binding response OmpR family regulator